MCIYLWLYDECSEFNLVLVIKDQGTARVTIDYIKKKPTDPGVSSYSQTSFYFIILNLVGFLGREGYSIKSLEITCYRRRKKDEGKGGEERGKGGQKNQQLITEIENMEPYITPFNE